jgi:single-strand DNA-binding protein
MFQQVILIGNATRDTEVRYTPNRTAVADVGIAVNKRIKKNDEWVDEPTFLDVTCWAKTAEIAGEYVKKGKQIMIEGELRVDKWENNEGEKRSRLVIVARQLKLLGGGPRSNGTTKKDIKTSPPQNDSLPIEVDNDVPF